MIAVDMSRIKDLEEDLKRFSNKAVPIANQFAINAGAFKTREASQKVIKSRMTTRNQFTVRSVLVEKSKRTLNIKQQESVVGSVAPYMETQEFGGKTSAGGAHQAVIPTGWSAGQEGQRPRTRVPRRANKLANIRLGTKIRAGTRSRKQDAFLRGLLAAREGQKFVAIDDSGGSSTAIYRVWGRAKRRGQFTRIKLKMVWSMRRSPARIPATPWLAPGVAEVVPKMPGIYAEALEFQVKRMKMFRDR